MSCNPSLDDFIEQDISIDPYLPLADNYFDFVIVPAMFQLFQRPKEMFQEINRVPKRDSVGGAKSFLSRRGTHSPGAALRPAPSSDMIAGSEFCAPIVRCVRGKEVALACEARRSGD